MAVDYICYLYGGKFSGPELGRFHCTNCGRMLFKHNSKQIMISNAYGVGTTDFVAGQKDGQGRPIFINTRCHTCKSLYKIMFS